MVQRLFKFGEDILGRVAADLLSNPRVTDALGRALQTAFETKGRFDRNVQQLLGLLNLPSRADVTRLLTKLEAIQGSLVNLNLKVDRVLAASKPAPRRRPSRKKGTAAAVPDDGLE